MKLKKINFRKFGHYGSGTGSPRGARSLRTHLQYTTAALILSGTFYSASASAQTNWTGGAGNSLWGTAGNWSTNLVPSSNSTVTNSTTDLITVNNGGTFGTFVDDGELDLTGGTFSGGLVNSALRVNNILTLDGATLANVEVLAPNNGSSVVIHNSNGNVLSNVVFDAGTNIDMATQANLFIDVEGATTFGGTTTLAAGANIDIGAGNVPATLTNDGTIQGDGLISDGYTGHLINNAVIDADIAGKTLDVQYSPMRNTGTIEATKGGTLYLNANTTDSGVISADGTGSQVELAYTTIAINGNTTVTSTNGGVVLLDGTTITSGTLNIQKGSSLTIAGSYGNSLNGLTVNGNLDMASKVNAFTLVQGATTFNGITNMAAGSSINIYQGNAFNAPTLTNNGTIRGAGEITLTNGYLDWGGGLTNNGTVDANLSGKTLYVTPLGVENSGTIEATNGATLYLGYSYQNANTTDDGTISANGKSSEVLLAQETLTVAGKATFSATNGGSLVLSGCTLRSGLVNITNGSLTFSNNQNNFLSSVTVDGNLDLATQSDAYTHIQGYTTFNGVTTMNTGATINIGDNNGYTELVNSGTIQGAGTIFQSYGGALTNAGTIDANANGQILTEAVNSFTNTGNLNASNGGTLTVQNTGVVGGDVNATSGSTVNLPNGINQTSGSSTIDGSLNTPAGNFTLGGGTLKGTGNINMSVVQTGGTFNPGSDPANMHVSGDLTIISGKYQLDLASLSSFDTLTVSGATDINGGNLYLDFLAGYHPVLNNSYQFLLSSFTPGQSGFSSITSNLTGYGFTYNNGIVAVGSVPPPAVPEASSVLSLMTMLGIGGVGLATKRRKKCRKAVAVC